MDLSLSTTGSVSRIWVLNCLGSKMIAGSSTEGVCSLILTVLQPTTRWLQHDQTLPLSVKGVACETNTHIVSRNEKLRMGMRLKYTYDISMAAV